MKQRMQSAGFPVGLPIIVDIEKLFTQMDELTKAIDDGNTKTYGELKGHIERTLSEINKGMTEENKKIHGELVLLNAEITGAVNELEQMAKNLKPAEFPSEIGLKRPKWYKDVDDAGIIKAIGMLAKLLVVKAIQQVDLSIHEKKSSALAVKLVTADGKSFYNAFGGGSNSSGGGPANAVSASRTPQIVNLTLVANTEQGYALPTGTTRIRFRITDVDATFQYGWAPSGPYKTVTYNSQEDIDELYLTSKTIYFLSVPGDNLELEIYT